MASSALTVIGRGPVTLASSIAGALSSVGRALFRPQARGIAAPIDPRLMMYRIPWGLLSGIELSLDEALQLSAVWACVDAISKAIAASRWNVFVREAGGNRVDLPRDPLDYILNVRPNPDMTAASFRRALLTNALLHEAGYAEIVKNNGGQVVELWPLPSQFMQPLRDELTGDIVYRYTPPSMKGRFYILSQDRVFKLQGGPTLTGLMGEHKLARCSRILALSIATNRHTESYYQNGASPQIVFEHPNSMGVGAAGVAAQERFLKNFAERHQGPDRHHKPLITEEGMKVTQLDNNAEKAQLIEGRQFQIEEIARFFGVPPHKIGHLLRATNNNIEHQGIEFTRDGLTPWTVELEQEADYKLFSPRSPKATKIDMEWLREGDRKSTAEADSLERGMGVSLNEILHRRGRNGVGPIGDVRVVNAGVQNLEAVAAAKAPPAPKTAPPAAAAEAA